jgi:metallo-beta-lactamase family protein
MWSKTMAKLTFLGAVEGVTGSMYLLEANGLKILLDCGLFQGRREEERANHKPLKFDINKLDAIVLSHAHLDHSGRLPLVVKEGFKGSILMTLATQDLIEVLLKDAASLQERDAEWENKRRKRSGKKQVEPLYTLEDVDQVLHQCHGIDYYQSHPMGNGISVRFLDAGHILGSAIVEITIDEDQGSKKLVFTGDLGNSQVALLRDPDVLNQADVVLLESTYGDREHRTMQETLDEFETVLEEASENGGNILIPSFAVGRTQEIIFRLGELYQKGKLRHQRVFLDSPMAIAVTEIYHRYQDIYNKHDRNMIEKDSGYHHHRSLHSFLPVLRYSQSTEESMAINKIDKGAVIIAGSGMCNGGRIRHHLKHNLWRQKSHVIFVGYQANGTPGRTLVDGTDYIKIAGEELVVRAQIHTLGGFSAHASQSQLSNWLNHFDHDPKPRVFLVHGEAEAKEALKNHLASMGWKPHIPSLGESITF